MLQMQSIFWEGIFNIHAQPDLHYHKAIRATQTTIATEVQGRTVKICEHFVLFRWLTQQIENQKTEN